MFDYNENVQRKISHGVLHVCHDCDKIIEEGAYINHRLYCPNCVREYFLLMASDELLEDISIDSHWLDMVDAIGGDAWEN